MKFDFKPALKSVRKFASKNAPIIFAVTGVAALGMATYNAYKAGKNVETAVNEKKEELDIPYEEKLPAKEYVKATWKFYLPIAADFTIGTLLIGQSVKTSNKRNATLLAAYKLSETAFTEYKNKVIETIGEKKEKDVVQKVAADRITNNPVSNQQVIITGKGKSLMYDTMMDKYFESDIETVRRSINQLNYRMLTEHYITINDYRYELGLRPCEDTGDRRGWDLDHGMIDVIWGSTIADDGRPCLTLTHNPLPRPIRREWE